MLFFFLSQKEQQGRFDTGRSSCTPRSLPRSVPPPPHPAPIPQSIDNPGVTCAPRYHIRRQYDSRSSQPAASSLTYYVGSHDSCKLHLSSEDSQKYSGMPTHTHTGTCLPCSVILTTHGRRRAQIVSLSGGERLAHSQSQKTE